MGKIGGPTVAAAVECAARDSQMEGQTEAVRPSNEGFMHFMGSQTPKGSSENAEATLTRGIRNVSRSQSPINSLKESSQVNEFSHSSRRFLNRSGLIGLRDRLPSQSTLGMEEHMVTWKNPQDSSRTCQNADDPCKKYKNFQESREDM